MNATATAAASRLSALRTLLRANRLDALLVPQADPHGSEYLSPCFERRAFLSGFTGSAGDAVVEALDDGPARVWTDGRYWLQAARELQPGWELMKAGEAGVPSIHAYLRNRGSSRTSSFRVGVDAELMGIARWNELARVSPSVELVATSSNLVDIVWSSSATSATSSQRPLMPTAPVVPHTREYAGATVAAKLDAVRAKIDPACAGVLVSALDSVAWLLNLRGGDVPFTPVFLAHVFVGRAPGDPIELFIDASKLASGAVAHVESQMQMRSSSGTGADVGDEEAFVDDGNSSMLVVRPYTELLPRLAKMQATKVGGEHDDDGGAVRRRRLTQIDFTQASAAVLTALGGNAGVRDRPCPTLLLKAVKNDTERAGMRRCHVRDGVAKTRFLFWLEDEVARRAASADASAADTDSTPLPPLTECDAADALEAYRARDPLFRGLSFPSISSADANAAVIHYAPHRKKGKGQNAVITAESLYLIDSGAQYLDGTTDVTRTVHLGAPTLHQRECFARVLKGFIAIHECVFPAGTLGAALDGLARGELWKSGLDFAHGVGHGVGSYLCVHEGPQAISCSTRGLTRPQVGFQRGMTVSDEPGYYEDGAFGIRIENILIARHAVTQVSFLHRIVTEYFIILIHAINSYIYV